MPPPRPEAERLRYFIPDWDDLVDSEYDFDEEVYSRGGGGWDREVYAHQLLERPAYDGILVSREVVRKSKKKRRHLEGLVGRGGIHRYLRVPERFPVFGDCGAFGYAKEDEPPYTTEDVLDYYERLGFNYGVSVDHLVALAPDDAARRSRYELTLANAEAFLRAHRAQGLAFRPIGAVQGWDLHTYREAARQTVAMGYDYIAVGGLVQTRTEEVLAVLEAVHDVVPPSVEVHAFGLARLEATADLVRLGVTSIDSASPLRKAWLDSANNYWTLDGVTYAAIRIPSPPKTMPALDEAVKREQAAIQAVRAAASSAGSVEDALRTLEAHHTAIEEHKRDLKVEKRRREKGITAGRGQRASAEDEAVHAGSLPVHARGASVGSVPLCGMQGRRRRSSHLSREQPQPPPRLPQHLRVLRTPRPGAARGRGRPHASGRPRPLPLFR